MAENNLVSFAVSLADDVTASFDLQGTVLHAAVKRVSPLGEIQYNDSGEVQWDYPEPRKAIINRKQKLRRAVDGTEKLTQYILTILEPIEVDNLDQFTMPDGKVLPPVMDVETLLDPQGSGYFATVYLG